MQLTVDSSTVVPWLAFGVSVFSATIAVLALLAARRSSRAAVQSAAIADLVEQRKRYGWAIELRDGREGLTLRNVGTLDAQGVSLVAGENIIMVMEDGYPGGKTALVRAGQGKAFRMIIPWNSGSDELTITWTAEGESERRTWIEPLPG